MHTTTILVGTDFDFQVAGVDATLQQVFPGFHSADRIGIVTRQPGGATGASALLLAAVTHFYDAHRAALGNAAGRLRIYPDYYIFHVGRCQGSHAQLDIWPPHKEVVVLDDAEQLLEAINDRGITRLLVEERPPAAAVFLRETLASARQRIVTALAYSPAGVVPGGDVSCSHGPQAEAYVRSLLSDGLAQDALSVPHYAALVLAREQLLVHGRSVERYRRIGLDAAFGMLAAHGEVSMATQRYIDASYPGAAETLHPH